MPQRHSSHWVGRRVDLVNRKAFPQSISGRDPQLSHQLQKVQLESESALQEQRRATALKETSLALEARAKTLDSYAGVVRKVVPMVALAYGLGVSFSYFFLAITFFPSGLSLGDTLLYVFIALGYGLLAFFFICAGLLVVLPVLAFDDGARMKGNSLRFDQGRGIWGIPPLIAPMFLALTVGRLEMAFEAFTNAHTGLVTVTALGVALVIGICSHRRAWRLGAGENSKPLQGFETWMPLGFANGLVFQWLYSFVIAGYGTAAIIPIFVSMIAGAIAWVAIDLFSTPIEGAKNSEVGNSRKILFKLEFRWGACLLAFSILLGVLAAFLGEFSKQYGACSFYIAAIALLCLIAVITFSPLVAVRQEELVGPIQPQEASTSLKDSARRNTERKIRALAILAALAFSTPLLADLVYMDQKISTAVFAGLGLREENTTVRLKGEALASLKSQARNSRVELSICNESDGSATVSPVNVLWHGLGQLSLLSIGKVDADVKTARNAPQMEVASEEIKILRHQGSHCRDVVHSVYFGSGKAAPAVPQQEQEMIEEVRSALREIYPSAPQANKSKWALSDIIVTGFADPMQLGEAGNEYLARQRSACLASKLFNAAKTFGLDAATDFNLRWDGEGARLPVKTSCPLTGDHAALSECHAVNRVAKVRLIFSCQGADGKASESCKLSPNGPVVDQSKEVAKAADPNFGGRAKASALKAEKQCSELVSTR